MRSISYQSTAVFGIALALIFALAPQVALSRTTVISITDTAILGNSLTIDPNDMVTWHNTGLQSHTITADNNSFTSGVLLPGARYSQVFVQPGTYPYYETLRGGPNGVGMSGVIRVAQQQTPIPIQTPVPVQTTNSTVTAQTQVLYAQVLQLQQVLAALQARQTSVVTTPVSNTPGISSGGACPRIGRTLKPGMSGDDVLRLQQFLATDRSVYPEASATGYYGVLTQAAVQRWQIKNNIVSTGSAETTGFGVVGPRTAAAIALQCSPGGTIPNTDTGPSVGGFIQVTPVSGDAPLFVSVQATVNTVNSCQGVMYVLDWGDGTGTQAIPVSAGACSSQQQTHTHTYSYGGQYTIKLSAGGHESTAVVVVNGPARPTTGTTDNKLVLTAPVGGQNLTAGQTISIAWQSSASFPAGSTIVFDLYSGAGQKIATNDVIAISSYPSGSLAWTIPTPGAICPAIYPGNLCGVSIPTGSYKIVAKGYAPSTAGNTYGPLIAEASSGIFTIIGSSVNLTDTFTASVTSGPPPLDVTFVGKLSSANKAWCEGGGCFNLLQFGDGSAEFLALPTAAGSTLGYSLSHTYASTGVYTAKLFQSQDTGGPLVGTAITITVGNAGTNFTYGPLELGPGVGTSTLAVSATFDLPTSCTAYRLNWGDGTAAVAQTQASNCAQTPAVKTLTHTYAQDGSYTVTLKRGASLDRTDSVGISIAN